MGFNVKVNLSRFDKKFSRSNVIRARKLAVNDAFQAMDKYVPYLSGALSQDSAISIDGKSIVYTMPYAKAQFYGLVGPKPGYPVHHWTTATHPQAGKRWDLALKGDKEDMREIMDTFAKGLTWKL